MSTKDELNKSGAFARRFDSMKKPFAAREGAILPESDRAISPVLQSALT
jgi:hypothetical protein